MKTGQGVVGVVPIVFRDKSVRAVLEVIALFYSKYVLKYSSKRGCNLRETLPKVMLWTLDLCVTVPAPPREGFFFACNISLHSEPDAHVNYCVYHPKWLYKCY